MTFKEEYTRENEEIRVSGGLQNKIIKENHKMKSTRRFGWKQGISAAAAIALVCVIAVIGAGKPAPANAFSFTANEADVPPDFKLNVPAELEINFENFVGQVVYGVTYDELRSSFSKTHSLYAFNISGENVEKVELSATSGTFVFGEGAEVTEQDGKFTVSGTTASLVVWTSDDAADGEIEIRAVATFKDGATTEIVRTITITNVTFSGLNVTGLDDGAQAQTTQPEFGTPPRDGDGAIVTRDYFTPPIA